MTETPVETLSFYDVLNWFGPGWSIVFILAMVLAFILIVVLTFVFFESFVGRAIFGVVITAFMVWSMTSYAVFTFQPVIVTEDILQNNNIVSEHDPSEIFPQEGKHLVAKNVIVKRGTGQELFDRVLISRENGVITLTPVQ